ncbi:tetratricopeptide repeat protein [Haliscomenobacter hydrossis]|uniref:Tetratricopeptide TPR_2 repeat-containing protein n=1 Tax=Haliscomenobacter hydrossis (strain ATCC 27775 / DSM 1100 / LMG 10767 / O) TaxID=760192 RepID=F4KY12_HALH1|nr:tetratricopeptide repeat protein [Haliscomenobacter hydrossis]AEE53637.1 Tetratricopeptide TPR_2 repeat-containing protein [Haliscomenobacter hydrossis DSM 1100]
MKSPFKFLDAYTFEDRANFFGRKEETEELYRMVFKSSLILIYGLSGTGKTSLVQCGLAGRFDGPDWLPLFVRRNEDVNQSLDRALQKIMPSNETAISAIPDRVSYLFKDYLRPIYLIFDQFEELFILGTEKEQDTLAQTLAQLTRMEAACRVILIIREEFIGQLYRLEKYLPRLFDFRLRVEPMGYKKVAEVVEKSCLAYNIGFNDATEQSIQAIYDNIAGGKSGVQLPYLQVYLDQLYRRDYARSYPNGDESKAGEWPVLQFSLSEINALGNIEDVLGRFLDEQKWQLQASTDQKFKDSPEDAITLVLDTFVTPEGTKRPISFTLSDEQFVLEKNVLQWIVAIPAAVLHYIVNQLIERRILRQNESSLELAHDALALLIDQRRSEGQRRVNDVLTRVLIAYKEHQDTHEYLSRKQLNIIEELWPLLKPRLSTEIQGFIEKSKAEVASREHAELLAEREKRRKATRAAMVAIGLALCATAAMVFASIKAEQVRRAKVELSIAFFNSQIQTAHTLKVEGKYQEALDRLQEVNTLKIDLQAPQRDTLQELQKEWKEIQQLVEKANTAIKQLDLNRGINLYRQAQNIGADERITGLIVETENKVESTYRDLINKGNLMLNANQLAKARESYEKALKLKPGDVFVQKKLRTLTAQ